LSLAGIVTVIHRFTGNTDGSLPTAPVVFDQTGTILYGTATAGGDTACTGGCGVAFRLSGTSLKDFKTMHTFNGAGGADPTGGLALDLTTTYLVGTTFAGGTDNLGVIFQLEQTGAFTLIHSFTGEPKDGANPFAGVLLGIAPPRNDSIPPPRKVGCPSQGCACTTVLGGASNLGSVVSD
jgi:uncharacterized repeat protein (TIGR03803 family)